MILSNLIDMTKHFAKLNRRLQIVLELDCQKNQTNLRLGFTLSNAQLLCVSWFRVAFMFSFSVLYLKSCSRSFALQSLNYKRKHYSSLSRSIFQYLSSLSLSILQYLLELSYAYVLRKLNMLPKNISKLLKIYTCLNIDFLKKARQYLKRKAERNDVLIFNGPFFWRFMLNAF